MQKEVLNIMVCLRCQKCSWHKDLNLCPGQKMFELANCSVEKFMTKNK